MKKKVEIESKTLHKIKLILEAQYKVFSGEEFIKQIPLMKRSLMKMETKVLKNLIKEIQEILEKKE